MKKTLCVLMAICAVGISLVSCSKKADEGFKIVESETCDFTFQCPESWEITHTNGMLSALNTQDISKANVTAHSFFHGLEKNPSSPEYWETYKTQLSNTFGDITVNDLKEKELGGQKVVHSDYVVSIADEIFYCETILVVYDSKVYTLTLTQGAKNDANSENYNDHSDEFEEIIKTFRIR